MENIEKYCRRLRFVELFAILVVACHVVRGSRQFNSCLHSPQ